MKLLDDDSADLIPSQKSNASFLF